MFLMVNVLEQIECLPAILDGFARAGIKGSTIVNSTGMGRVLMQAGGTAPVMDRICHILEDCETSNKTIFTVVRDQATLDKAIAVVRAHCGDLSQPGKGILFTVPIGYIEGLPEGD